MSIDELVNSINESKLREQLAKWVIKWKSDDNDIHVLYEMVVKWHGNTWFKDEVESNQFYANLQAFKAQAIDNIGGLTVNERLFLFGLFNEWDNSDSNGQQRIRGKLHAPA